MGSNVLKIACGTEIRRVPILTDKITYNELCLLAHRLFKHHLSSSADNLLLKYIDDGNEHSFYCNGDLISIVDDFDVKQAVCIGQVLRIKVYGNASSYITLYMSVEKEKESGGRMKVEPSIKDQLLELKAKIDTLLDSFENVAPVKEEGALKEDPISNAPSTIPTTKKATSTMSKTALNASDMAELLGVASLESVGEGKKEQQEGGSNRRRPKSCHKHHNLPLPLPQSLQPTIHSIPRSTIIQWSVSSCNPTSSPSNLSNALHLSHSTTTNDATILWITQWLITIMQLLLMLPITTIISNHIIHNNHNDLL